MAQEGGLMGLKNELKALRNQMADNLVMQDALTESAQEFAKALSEATDATEIAKLNKQIEQNNELLTENVKKQEAVATAAGQTKDRMSDINEQVAIFAGGSQFEKASNSLGGFGSKLASMDFQGASEDAARFKNLMQGIGKAEVLDGFKNMVKGVKDVGAGFASVGKTLLLNPIFLIPIIIGVIVVAIVLLKDKFKIMSDAFDMIMKPIKIMIQGLKDLSDWLGLTSFKMDESAERANKASERHMAASDKQTKKQISDINQRIELAKIEGKDTVQLEIERQKIIKDGAQFDEKELQATIKRTEDKIKRNSAANANQKKALIEATKDLKEKLAEQREIINQANNDVINIKATDAKAKQDIEDKADAEAREKFKANVAKRIAQQKEYAKLRLDTARQLEDLSNSNLTDDLERELAINKTKYDRLSADTLSNMKLLQTEKDALIAQFETQRVATDAKIKTDNKTKQDAIDKAETDALKKLQDDKDKIVEDYNKKHFDRTATDLQKAQQAVKESFDEEEALLKSKYDKGLIKEEEYQIALAKLRGEYTVASAKVDADNAVAVAAAKEAETLAVIAKVKEKADLIMSLATEINNLLNAQDANRLNDIKNRNAEETTDINNKMQAELSATGLSAEEKTRIENKYKTEKYNSDVKANNAQNEIKKKEFNRNKALSLVNIAISTAEAIAKSVALSPTTFGLPWSAVNAAIGAVQLGVVASTKFQGDAGPAAPQLSLGAPAGGGGGAGGNSSAPATPAFNLFGNPNNFNNAGAPGSSTSTQNITVNAIVSESQITTAQTAVNKYQQSAEL